MVRAAQKGEAKASSPEVSRAASSIKMKDAKKFASTKHKGLPEKKMKKESVSEDAKMARQSDENLAAAHKKFSSMDQSPANKFMLKRVSKEIARRKKGVKEAVELKKAKINYKTTKKGGKTTHHVNKNDEADAQKAMKNDPKYILGKTRVKPVKEEEAFHSMSSKEFKKTHKDFKSGSKKKGNARVTKGVTNPSGTTTPISRRVKFTDEYVPEGANPYGKRAKIKMIIKGFSEKNRSKAGAVKEDAIDENIVKDVIANVKKVGGKIKDKVKDAINRPIMAPTINKQQHLQKIRNSGGNPSHWESAQNEGALATGAALTAAGLAAWKFSQGMKTRNQMKKSIDTPGTKLNSIKNATDQKNKMLQQLNQSHEPEGEVVEDFYKKKYDVKKGGYQKTNKMTKSNKRSGDSKAQYRELHKDLAKEDTIVEKKKMVKIKVNKPIKTKVTDVGAGGKEYVRKDWSEENLVEIKFSFRKTSKPKTEKKAEKAQDAGARGRRLIKRREYAAKISGSEDNVPDDLRDHYEVSEGKKKGLWDNIHAKRKRGEAPAKKGYKDYPKTLNVENELKNIKQMIKTKTMNGKTLSDKQIQGLKAGLTQGGNKVQEGAAWTKKAGKNKSGGLNEKGRKSYEKENPGSDLKAPSKKKGNKRRASFCARMKGMKKKLTSKKTASDPDSRINKSLRAWNCSYEFDGNEIIITEKDTALDLVKKSIHDKYGKGAIMRKGSNQKKKVRGEKSTSGTGKYLKKHQEKQQLKKDAKEMGYGKDTKSYVNTRARYGSKENMKSGKGLGT